MKVRIWKNVLMNTICGSRISQVLWITSVLHFNSVFLYQVHWIKNNWRLLLSGLWISHYSICWIIVGDCVIRILWCLILIMKPLLIIVFSWNVIIIICILFLFLDYSLLTINVSWILFYSSLNLKLSSKLYLL